MNLQLLHKPNFEHKQVGVNEFKFGFQRYKFFVFGTEHIAVDIREMFQKLLRRRGVLVDEGR